jgi:ribosome-associated toxin RatA of RatAB toxin-antitoxin module
MRTVKRSALVPYSTVQMYDIINDIEGYPSFLPWCVDSEVLFASEIEQVARLDLARGGLAQSFTTRNRLSPPLGMTLELVEGPFTALSGTWALQALGDEGCKISMEIHFEFNSRMMNAALSQIFTGVIDKMVEAFCRRADQLHG